MEPGHQRRAGRVPPRADDHQAAPGRLDADAGALLPARAYGADQRPDRPQLRDHRALDAVVEVPGEAVTEPGAHLLLGIKAATRAAYDANVVAPDPDADPLAQQITIIWNPINDTGTVTFQVEDRGAALGVLAAPIADLITPTYAIRYPGAEATQELKGWKLDSLIKAATDHAIAASRE